MSTSKPLAEEVATVLVGAGYRRLSLPFMVASIPFDFTAVLVATERASDLLVVIDTVAENEEFVLRRKVEGLSRALDVAGSNRPLTAILVGPSPPMNILDKLGRVCRILLVTTPLGPRANWIKDALAVLLPLRLPLLEEPAADPIEDLYTRVSGDIEESVFHALISATLRGPESVEEAFRNLLEDPLKLEDVTGDIE
jgi:hypothetical protein